MTDIYAIKKGDVVELSNGQREEIEFVSADQFVCGVDEYSTGVYIQTKSYRGRINAIPEPLPLRIIGVQSK